VPGTGTDKLPGNPQIRCVERMALGYLLSRLQQAFARLTSCIIRCRFILSGKNDGPTPDLENDGPTPDFSAEWLDDVQPRNAIERDLTAQAARLTLDIERAERIGMSHLAHRVLLAARLRTRKLSARRRKQVHELSRRLLTSPSRNRSRSTSSRSGTTPLGCSSASSKNPPGAAAGCWSAGWNTATCWTTDPSGKSRS
jgi:hypothetical protein